MKKLAGYTNYRIEVIPEELFIFSKKSIEESHRIWVEHLFDCEKSIKRHCDNIRTTDILWDKVEVCSYCNDKWTEESLIYNGGCCEEDERNNPTPNESI